MENLKIEIRPIENRDDIRKFSDNLEYFSKSHVIGPFVNPVTLKYSTGLSEEDKEYLESRNCPYNLDDDYVTGVAHEFWESSIVKTELKSTPTFLFPQQSIIDFIKWKYLLVNNYIYKSEAEMLTGTKPEATHFIYNESEELAVKAKRIEVRQKLQREVESLSQDEMRNILLLMFNEDTSTKNSAYLTVRFESILKNGDQASILRDLLQKSKEDLNLSAFVRKAINHGQLTKTRQGIFYFDTNLGFSEEDVQNTLSKPENQELILSIKSKIE